MFRRRIMYFKSFKRPVPTEPSCLSYVCLFNSFDVPCCTDSSSSTNFELRSGKAAHARKIFSSILQKNKNTGVQATAHAVYVVDSENCGKFFHKKTIEGCFVSLRVLQKHPHSMHMCTQTFFLCMSLARPSRSFTSSNSMDARREQDSLHVFL